MIMKQTRTLIEQAHRRAGAVDSRIDSNGATIQVDRTAGRPQYSREEMI
jgi:hypothetical protein